MKTAILFLAFFSISSVAVEACAGPGNSIGKPYVNARNVDMVVPQASARGGKTRIHLCVLGEKRVV
jgi:hypothetical protein